MTSIIVYSVEGACVACNCKVIGLVYRRRARTKVYYFLGVIVIGCVHRSIAVALLLHNIGVSSLAPGAYDHIRWYRLKSGGI